VKSGTVTRIQTGYDGGYGQNIVIQHGDGSSTRYCHLSKIVVSGEGVFVSAGQRIGLSGNTGSSKGPHLHFGYYIKEGGNLYAVDPVTHGLDQPNNGDAYLYDGPMYKAGASNGEYTNGIYFLTKDNSGKFTRRWYGLVPFWTAGETVRIMIEAYDKMNETPNTTTNPYRIDLKITNSNGNIVKDADGRITKGNVC
ncbi:MAG: M23 family metallopeptidase, partial [Thermoplasmata archaeon]